MLLAVAFVCQTAYKLIKYIYTPAETSAEVITQDELEQAYDTLQKDPNYADFQNVIEELMGDFK